MDFTRQKLQDVVGKKKSTLTPAIPYEWRDARWQAKDRAAEAALHVESTEKFTRVKVSPARFLVFFPALVSALAVRRHHRLFAG